jgi:4-hydroxy-2-oxoheptanedioate aldolase
MRTNRLKEKLAAGKMILGSAVGFHSPDTIELLGVLGLDYVTLDLEHEVFDELAVLHSIRAAESVGITPIARVANDSQRILRLLDAGVQGIHIPRVNTKADAESAASAARFYPDGTRSFFATARSGDYGFYVSEEEYAATANRETLVTAQIEEDEGVTNLDAILSVPGIDVIQVGPKDLWQSMGMPDRKVVQKVADDIITRAIKAGKWVSSYVWLNADLPSQVARLRGLGVQMLTVPARDLVAEGARAFLAVREE